MRKKSFQETYIGVILFLLSYKQILEIRYRDYPDYIKAEKEFMADPTNTMLEQRANEERMKIDLK